MLENPPKEASFDHVDADGNLIFIFENTPLSIKVDDTLEHAIAESQKITQKHSDNNSADNNVSAASSNATLPISQIQALIRAGVDPSHVAKRYNVSEAQVRRFSAGVETEKQYAIEQFLLVPAPKQSNMRTLADLIERTLAKAHIGMETVQWRATRRGLEPWLISATFKTATRTIKAEWTWNMHDNSVTCANPSSRLLLGEDANGNDAAKQAQYGGMYRDTVSINFPFSTEELPGNSIRSARIERAVSQWELRNSDKLSEISNSSDISDSKQEHKRAKSRKIADSSNDLAENALSNSSRAQQPSLIQSDYDEQDASSNILSYDSSEAQKSLADKVKQTEKAEKAKRVEAAENAEKVSSDAAKSVNTTSTNNEAEFDANQESDSAKKNSLDHADHNNNKRRSGRAAVPSWDEILFGEG
ncbi:septation protein SepH [Gardnerella greenwoodii]|uniref:septation protein SepH n=1 Tax=Gardnerella greenwoodii TaxID=2914925 RepID=UPI0039EE17EF